MFSVAKTSELSKEDAFHLTQMKQKAAQRIKSSRPCAVDLLLCFVNICSEAVKNARIFEDCDILPVEPFVILNDLDNNELLQLKDEVAFIVEAEHEESEYWMILQRLVDDELKKLSNDLNSEWPTKERLLFTSVAALNPASINAQVLRDIHESLSKKSLEELLKLEKRVNTKLKNAGTTQGIVDVDYWETMLAALKVFKDRSRLIQIYQSICNKRIEQLKARGESDAAEELLSIFDKRKEESVYDYGTTEAPQIVQEQTIQEDNDVSVTLKRSHSEEYLLQAEETPQVKRKKALSYKEKQLNALLQVQEVSEATKSHSIPFVPFDDSAAAAALYLKEARRLEAIHEAAEGDKVTEFHPVEEVQLPVDVKDLQGWKKPRFLNRVMMGFEWNKYNQTHYSADNPPPKKVQGYRFIVFYPELIGSTVTPSYKLIKDPESPKGTDGQDETVLLKFTAGHPYLDVCFRIKNQEWECAHWRGFLCRFYPNGVLYLQFRFKKDHFRR